MRTGFSLIETLLYVAFLGIAAVVLVNLLFALGKTFVRVKTLQATGRSGQAVMERMLYEIRSAQTIGGGSVFGTHPGILQLAGGPTPITFALSPDARVTVQEGSNPPVALSASSSPVTNLVFRDIHTGRSLGVKVELTIGGANFFTTALLRGSYTQ